jgi:hypothetical protein
VDHQDAILQPIRRRKMPCGGAWPAEDVALLSAWIDGGLNPEPPTVCTAGACPWCAAGQGCRVQPVTSPGRASLRDWGMRDTDLVQIPGTSTGAAAERTSRRPTAGSR